MDCASTLFREIRIAKTIDFISTFVFTNAPVLWTLFAAPQEEMWRRGLDEFSTTRISSLKAHLKGGGELWINVDQERPHVMAAVQQGPAEHRRTRKNGCVMSVTPTGEGDVDLI